MLQMFKKHTLLLISTSPTYCSLSLISQQNNRLILHAYQEIACHNLELEKGLIFNPTEFKNWIRLFIKQYQIKHPLIAATIAGHLIQEKLIFSTAQDIQELNNQCHRHFAWHYTYLCNYQDHALYYTVNLPQSILLQLKLISIALKIPLSLITTEKMSLLRIYQYIKGSSFRLSQLSIDLFDRNGLIEQLFDEEMMYRVLTLATSISYDNPQIHQRLLTAAGLYLIEKDDDEKN